jgi:SAM-dependent methyltransferase
MNAVAWAVQSVHQRGLSRTLKVASSCLADLTFDWRYGTDTGRRTPVWNPVPPDGALAHDLLHQPTKARPLRRLLESLNLPLSRGFVDLGSGKGRALLVAAQHGFRDITGVEFSGRLCDCARRNAARFAQTQGLPARIEVVCGDAGAYAFRPDQEVLFLYNPFDEVVLGRVLANLRRSLAEAPRTFWLLYANPVHGKTVESCGLFSRLESREIAGGLFLIGEHE